MISINKWIRWLEECHITKTPIRIANDEFVLTKETFFEAAKRVGVHPRFTQLVEGKMLIHA